MIITNCKYCKKPFSTHKAWIKKGSGLNCSRECSYKSKKYKAKTLISKTCEACSIDFKIRKGSGGNGRFCSRKCLATWRGKFFSGANHPCWKGGKDRSYRSKKIIEILKRERGCCAICKSTEYLQGNHIKPWIDFPEDRENPQNIEILCIECHAERNPKYRNFILSKKKGK